MPRPGPRPYECVRRAWHSDRHQPMRGSLIQEIFRVVSEIHTSATKKNKEWQEKLPVVVLKAEEIMYSKANSESEYMDFTTLFDRTNDAINTIIRREENTETGELLQPCIEAALILGCTARRASRSQRNNNPRCYLNQGAQESSAAPSRAPDNVTHGGSSSLPLSHPGNLTSAPRFMPHYPTTARPTTMNTTQLRSDSCSPVAHNSNPTLSHGFPFAVENRPNQVFAVEDHRPVNVGRAYPLYYDRLVRHQTTDSPVTFRPPQVSVSTSSVPARPQAQSILEPVEKGVLQSLFTNDGSENAANKKTSADLIGNIEYPPTINCDLSLRLGPLSPHCASAEARCSREVDDIESSSSQEGSKVGDPHKSTTKEFCFFPCDNAGDPQDTTKWNSRDGGPDLEGPSRKRKEPVNNLLEGEHFSHQPKFSNNLYFSRMNERDK